MNLNRRIVVDVNVYISALAFGGTPAKAFDRIEFNRWEIIISSIIYDDILKTLINKFKWDQSRATTAINELIKNALTVEPTEIITVCRDVDDNHIIECAISSNAELILTGDKDLLELHPFQKINIFTPADFLKIY